MVTADSLRGGSSRQAASESYQTVPESVKLPAQRLATDVTDSGFAPPVSAEPTFYEHQGPIELDLANAPLERGVKRRAFDDERDISEPNSKFTRLNS
jgi:hypothetical protein